MRRRKAAPQWATWPLEAIKPYPANARTHPPEQVALLARMLKRWGPDQPIVVDEAGTILKGHGRLLAAKEAGLAEFPVVQRSGLSKTDKQAIRLADNQIALLSGWDASLIAAELGELKVADFDLSLLGFAEIDFRKWGLTLGTEGLTDPEETPPLPEEPVVRTGDLWELGEHRLLCGSATDRAAHERVVGSSKVDAVITDPPYGVGIDYASFNDTRENTQRLIEDFMPLVIKWPVVALTSGHTLIWSYPRPTWILMWVHPAGMGRGPWGFNCSNPILVWGADPYLKNKLGGRADTIVLAVGREKTEGHPVAKPIKVWQWLVERTTIKSKQIVFDPFVGSGTTIIAAEMTGRKCLAIEIDPSYVEVCINRWQNFTGKLATLKGKTLEEVRKERATPPARSGKRRKLKEFHPVSLDT